MYESVCVCVASASMCICICANGAWPLLLAWKRHKAEQGGNSARLAHGYRGSNINRTPEMNKFVLVMTLCVYRTRNCISLAVHVCVCVEERDCICVCQLLNYAKYFCDNAT